MTSTPLISISDLIGESWKFFIKHWWKIFQRLILFVPVGIPYVLGVVLLATKISFLPDVIRIALGILLILAFIIGLILVTLSIVRYILAEELPNGLATKARLWPLVLPALLLSIILSLCITGSFVLLIIPGIWFSVAAGFAYFLFLDQNLRGFKSISGSIDLVRGRWWPTFGRLLLIKLLFTAIFLGISMMLIPISLLIFGLIGGTGLAFFGLASASSGVGLALMILGGLASLLIVIVLLLLMVGLNLAHASLSLIVSVKLYKSLKESR
jgi:hypothetical protein